MAHYTKIGKGSIVTRVHVLDNEVLLKDGKEDEATGAEFLQNIHGNKDLYIQTSYNGTFRKNYAGIGYKYDLARDAFIEPKPFDSWILDEDTCRWDAPIPRPDDDKTYVWDEDTTSWKEI
jgi:hypothetical protein